MMSVIEAFATLFTISMFVSGLSVVKRIKASPTVSLISPFPAFATIINCMAWCKYALITEDVLMIVVNAVGVAISIYLVYCHYSYTDRKAQIEKMAFSAALILTALLVYVNYLAGENALAHLGVACCVACVVMFSSPLVSIRTVIATRSTYCLSFPLSITSLFTSTLWAWYGYTINDMFVFAPNFAGAVLAMVQVSMFALYKGTSVESSDIPL
ncbi:Sugar transporter [Tieghemiomyces parasiticus]|uniref:Sugar transporter SWEET1 n=1 Tax=Tieghemiomyces parasiticus TaxID=78921 RepID=A0A9W8DYS2_9FUNG|nr:Sugar transporter [Tieghemiomyces parasiticus]